MSQAVWEVRHYRETEEDVTFQGVSLSEHKPKSRQEPNPARRRVHDATISSDIHQGRDLCLELVTSGILDAVEMIERSVSYVLSLSSPDNFPIPHT